jgi:hypothetical protein
MAPPDPDRPRGDPGPGPDPDPTSARTPPTRPDERGDGAAPPGRAGEGAVERGLRGRSRDTSAESPEQIAGRPGTTQHVPADGVPPGAERRDPDRDGGGGAP